jgi:hypothetical protein
MVTLPRTIEDWKALPELPLGRYLVVNLGMMDAPLLACRAAGIQGLPPPEGDEVGLDVRLPNITVEERGHERLYRLPLDFGPIAKAMYDDAGRLYQRGQHLLPAYYTFGIASDGAYAIPEGASGSPRNLSRK